MIRFLVASFLVVVLGACTARPPVAEPADSVRALGARDTLRPEWADAFRAYGAEGVFVLYEPESGVVHRSDAALAAERWVPASTFKLYNALVALETGVVRDADSTFAWDGVTRSIEPWNRDHTLRTGMESSVVWLYQRVATRVGAERYRAAFAREPYGNGAVGGDVTTFWLDGPLAISADEQVAFVDRLRRGDLAFRDDVQATVRDLAVTYRDAGATIHGKTGWATLPDGRDLGWLVGWVERTRSHHQGRGRVAVFALRALPLDPARGWDVGPSRLQIARTILTVDDWLDALN